MRKIIGSGKKKTRLETIILKNFACGTICPSAPRPGGLRVIVNYKMPLLVIMVDAGRHLVRTLGYVAGGVAR